jgi:hypothetical protein
MQAERLCEAKTQEAGLWLFSIVDILALSREQVEQYNKLFLSAVKWYGAEEVYKDKRNESIISDREYSLLIDLKGKIEQRKEIPSGSIINLLQVVMGEYQAHLLSLKEKPWVRKEAIDGQLAQMKELTRNNDLPIK